MANPIFQALQGAGGMGGGLPNMLQMFNAFRSGFQGDPRQIVQSLLDSGRMSQDQLNQYMAAARNFQQMTGIK